MEQLKFILKYIKKHKLRYGAGILTLFIVDFSNIFIPRLTGQITDGLAANTFGAPEIRRCLLGIFLLGCLLAAGRFLWRYFLFGTARTIEKELRGDLFSHLETMSVEYYNTHKTGDLMTRFTSDLNAIRMAIGMAVIALFDAVVLTLMVLFQMIVYVDIRLTLLVLIPMILIALGEIYYGKIIKPLFTARQEAVSDMMDYVQESFSGIRVIKAFVRERSQILEFLKADRNTMDKSLRVVRLQAIVMPLLDVAIGLSSLITLIYGGYLALIGEITLGRFVAFNQYIGLLVWPMLACGESMNLFSQGAASAARVQEILKTDPEIRDLTISGNTVSAGNTDSGSSASSPLADNRHLSGNISLSHLSFTHADHSVASLSDITLDIPAGTMLAIIGKTGSGKSTLVNLLLHLYKVPDNMIFFDGQDLNHIPLKLLRGDIAYVPQDNFLFSDTLANNIAFGSDVKTEEAIEEAARLACLHDSILEFPEGYHTLVGERGVTLSGGQKQRSSIARAFLKDAPILILDDALSAVDTDTERQLLTNLRHNRIGKTTILIAHRISTVQDADLILVLKDGKIAELGSHETLLQKNGIYK
ncbi:MAG: ABC transporter ATP-binding protein, partial [Lachnospiraceae bacterium]|nr:ABC transporter ATP-binding protein [Lachnospiraceae bacterium]